MIKSSKSGPPEEVYSSEIKEHNKKTELENKIINSFTRKNMNHIYLFAFIFFFP